MSDEAPSTAVTFHTVEFTTGKPLADLPVSPGASWATLLNKPDSLSCEVDLRSEEAQALDIDNVTEEKRVLIYAKSSYEEVLAFGLISSSDKSEDGNTLSIEASGFWQYLNRRVIAPPAAKTGQLILSDGTPNPAMDTTIQNFSLGTIGKKLVAQAMSWPGADGIPVAYPADQVESRPDGRTYLMTSLKFVGAALTDLVNSENGPDFAFDAVLDRNSGALSYVMRHGSTATPRLGVDRGVWNVGGEGGEVEGFHLFRDGVDISTMIWGSSGRTAGQVLFSRVENASLITDAHFPPLDYVDTSHSDVAEQATLDSYARQNASYTKGPYVETDFTVQGDAAVRVGQYQVGDYMTLDLGTRNNYGAKDGTIRIRITSISGDETGKKITIGCTIVGGL